MDDFLLERLYPETSVSGKDHRHATEHDRSRILHSAAFRRLQGKTQVFGAGQADFYRTRLTHSLEVAQIARAITNNLCEEHPDLKRCVTPELAEAVALAHDIGHPPFGHAGERALDACMREVSRDAGFDGKRCLCFEANAQTFHILSVVEPKSPAYPGLNLTRATLTGVMKYPFEWDEDADKFIFNSDIPTAQWALNHGGGLIKARSDRQRTQTKTSIVCQIMNWADDCAYSVHDVEDALQARFLHPGDFDQAHFTRRVFERYEALRAGENVPELSVEETTERLINLKRRIMPSDGDGDERAQRKSAMRDILDGLILSVSLEPIAGSRRADFSWRLVVDLESSILAVLCKAVILEAVITDPRVAAVNIRGREILRDLFNLFLEEVLDKRNVALFPRYYRPIMEDAINKGLDETARSICNFLALMTDMDALRMHALLLGSKTSSIFDFI